MSGDFFWFTSSHDVTIVAEIVKSQGVCDEENKSRERERERLKIVFVV
jgi:hypothetical protein